MIRDSGLLFWVTCTLKTGVCECVVSRKKTNMLWSNKHR